MWSGHTIEKSMELNFTNQIKLCACWCFQIIPKTRSYERTYLGLGKPLGITLKKKSLASELAYYILFPS